MGLWKLLDVIFYARVDVVIYYENYIYNRRNSTVIASNSPK